jgi:hypothetical protein
LPSSIAHIEGSQTLRVACPNLLDALAEVLNADTIYRSVPDRSAKLLLDAGVVYSASHEFWFELFIPPGDPGDVTHTVICELVSDTFDFQASVPVVANLTLGEDAFEAKVDLEAATATLTIPRKALLKPRNPGLPNNKVTLTLRIG